MDDDDADYMQGSEDEVAELVVIYLFIADRLCQDYGFDYSDDEDEGNQTMSADVENIYYTAKCE